ncbi:hypothetical protein MFLAVUS_010597 [Mucor flavus]|uniref:Zn(2)-C6 fungal-type domain-containing protein n=1 Tax=Mucor flavus TaxID=439312 RepID=A0ABP9ZD69_9FUNG
MTGTLRWHSCSTNDFPLKRHKVSKACEACRGKKMRCDGNNPCQRCESNKIKCIYNDKPARSRSTPVVKKPVQLSPNPSSSNSSATLSPPPPTAQRSSGVITPKMEENVPTLCLNKITFVNELYETLRLHQTPKTRRYGTSIPPLLLDFFNTTSQPQTIWTYFILCLDKIYEIQPISDNPYILRDAPEEESSELAKEAFQIFITHNLLYGLFIDTPLLLFVISSVSMFPYMQQSNLSQTITTKDLPFHPSCLPFYSIVIYCILAITFQSAYQSLPNMNENFTNNLYAYSHLFYREAHKLFLAACFPTSPADPTPTTTNNGYKREERKRHLILLVQASVLLAHFQSTAISEEQAFLTVKMGIHLAQQGELTVIDDDDDEKESLFALLKSLDGWYVWLAFYLQKPYSALEFDIAPIATARYDVMFERKSKEQRWAICDLLKSLRTSNENEEDDFVPGRVIQVYHDILSIQLHSSQLDNDLQSIAKDTLDASDYTTLDTLNVCISSSQNILTNINKVIFADYSNTNVTAPLKYIPLSIIYSTCLVSQINLYFLKNKKSPSTLFKPSAIMRKEIDTLQSNLVKVLKSASPCFEAFQILRNKFNPPTLKRVDTTSVNKTLTISPSPTSLSTSSSTTTHTTNPLPVSSTTTGNSAAVVINPTLASETNNFLSSFHTNNHNDLLIANDAQHMTMNLPMTGGISSRADIDREQLEKLSHTKSHHNHHYQNHQQQQLQQQQQQHIQQQNIQQQNMQQQQQQQQQLQLQHQQMLLQKQQLNQFQLQQQQQPNSYYLPKYTRRTENGFNAQQQPLNDPCYYYKNNQGQKRSYQPQQQQQQLYNQFDYSIAQPALKRQRSNTAISYDMYPTNKSNQTDGVVMEGSHHERSKSVAAEFIELESTSDEFMYNMWMLEGTTPTPTEEIYDNRQQLKAHPSYTNNMSFLSPQTAPPQAPPPPPPQQENNNSGVTKLPLPQISKQTSMLSKRWLTSAQAQKTNNIFFHSEVQTLHYQTPPLVNFDTNTSFPMVGLNVIQEVDQEASTSSNLMYSASHRASIVSDHSGSSGDAGSGHHLLSANVVNSSSASTEETTTTTTSTDDAAAAAAVAVWASTAASFPKMQCRQYNHSTTASSSSLDEGNDRVPPLYQQQQGTSNSGTVHWINSEKVGDEEYWVD